jgi:uncharacterized protein YbbC (DUF1343 family)
MEKALLTFILCTRFLSFPLTAQVYPDPVQTGAERTALYFPLLANKKIALTVNHTSVIGSTHLADTLLREGFRIQKIFAPEHGFRGMADAGESINDQVDSKTGIPIISLYGDKKKPGAADLQGIELMIYDIQDVGVRFYTYVSTLHLLMQACAEAHIPLLILDRPNPNGFFVDGPVLDTTFRSFVGMDPVPVVYGMTAGEYAMMLNGEQWIGADSCELIVIPCLNYSHTDLYKLPIPPSPNLRSAQAIWLYPSLCFFEGTVVSVGRGTTNPFTLIGYPGFTGGNTTFTPVSMAGAKSPPYLNQACGGIDLSIFNEGFFKETGGLQLHWLIRMYKSYSEKDEFFNSFFDKLAGSDELRKMISDNTPEHEIRHSWKPEIESFKVIRKKYLLYPDFE